MASREHMAVVLVLAAVGLAACPAPEVIDDEIPPPPYASFDARPCPPESVLTWENFGQPFMRNWCTGCHAAALDEAHREEAPVGIDFDDLDGVREHADRIWVRAADQNNTMPPAGLPPVLEREQLGEWLACGAPTRDDL